MTNVRPKLILLLIFVFLLSGVSTAQSIPKTKQDTTLSGYKANLKLGTPTNKDAEMERQDIAAPYYRFDPKLTAPWFDWKRKLNDSLGLKISMNYTSTFITATSRIDEDNEKSAASGIFDLTFNYTLFNRKKGKNQGSLVYWIDQRHLYMEPVGPQFLNFETGSATFPALKFGEWSLRTLEFYYQQKLFDDRIGLVIGKIDMADWFTYNGLLHPMRHFSDFAFSVNPTVSWSNPGFGFVLGGWLNTSKTLALIAGMNDVAGDNVSSDRFLDFGEENFFNGKFLKMAELVWSPGADQSYFKRISATAWHSDALTPEDGSFLVTEESRGISLQGTWFIAEKYIPIATFGWSDGNGANALSKLHASLVHGWYMKSHDLFAIGFNYTKSSINDESQWLSEIFYRYTLGKTIEITPNIKGVLNPVLDPDRDFLMYFGLRSRFML